MHRKEEKDQPWQKIELIIFFLLMKQQNIMEQFVFAWSNDCSVAGKQLVPES